MNETVVTLPESELMLERLRQVSGDNHLEQFFYPLLLNEAGTELDTCGIAMAYTMAVMEYVKDERNPLMIPLRMLRDRFIDALVPDESAAQEVKEHLRNMDART